MLGEYWCWTPLGLKGLSSWNGFWGEKKSFYMHENCAFTLMPSTHSSYQHFSYQEVKQCNPLHSFETMTAAQWFSWQNTVIPMKVFTQISTSIHCVVMITWVSGLQERLSVCQIWSLLNQNCRLCVDASILLQLLSRKRCLCSAMFPQSR